MPPAPAPVSAVPHRLRLICALTAGVVVGAMVVVALLLTSSSTGVVTFGLADQIAMVGLGLALGGGILFLGRSRVDADAHGIRIRNVVGQRELPWAMVREVRFDRRSAWATLLLSNEDEIAVLAVQAVDKERAVRAVAGLRALHAAAVAAAGPKPAPPPLLYPE